MNRNMIVFGVALLALLPAFTSPPKATANNAAIVINDGGCTLLDGNGAPVFSAASHEVLTSSGHATFKCSADVTPSSSGNAVKFDYSNTGGGECGTAYGLTTDWHEEISASGQATLTCLYNQ